MARINNQAIMQKLIDELELYPAKDTIPTELAEKLLPVFQVNTQDVNVNFENNIVKKTDSSAMTASLHTYTVPADKKWNVKLISHKLIATATVANRNLLFRILDDTGATVFEVGRGTAITASQTKYTNFALGGWTSIADLEIDSGVTFSKILPFPQEIILLEGWSLEVWEIDGSGDVLDASTFTLLVDEQDN